MTRRRPVTAALAVLCLLVWIVVVIGMFVADFA